VAKKARDTKLVFFVTEGRQLTFSQNQVRVERVNQLRIGKSSDQVIFFHHLMLQHNQIIIQRWLQKVLGSFYSGEKKQQQQDGLGYINNKML